MTLDRDATIKAVEKKEALACYKGFPAFQPLNVWLNELELIVHSEFRDGNVPAAFDNLRVFQESLEMLPEGVKRVRFRSDTAGYQRDLLLFMGEGKHPRFETIEFAVGADVTRPNCLGAKAAWWAIMILALNLSSAMSGLVLAPALGKSWRRRRLKAIRFLLIGLPGRVVDHARELWIRIGGKAALDRLRRVRVRIAAIA